VERFFGKSQPAIGKRGSREISDDRSLLPFQVWAAGVDDIADVVFAWGGEKVQVHISNLFPEVLCPR
jgi:hypothetical protein